MLLCTRRCDILHAILSTCSLYSTRFSLAPFTRILPLLPIHSTAQAMQAWLSKNPANAGKLPASKGSAASTGENGSGGAAPAAAAPAAASKASKGKGKAKAVPGEACYNMQCGIHDLRWCCCCSSRSRQPAMGRKVPPKEHRRGFCTGSYRCCPPQDSRF